MDFIQATHGHSGLNSEKTKNFLTIQSESVAVITEPGSLPRGKTSDVIDDDGKLSVVVAEPGYAAGLSDNGTVNNHVVNMGIQTFQNDTQGFKVLRSLYFRKKI